MRTVFVTTMTLVFLFLIRTSALSQTEIKLTYEDGRYTTPCKVNDLSMKMEVATGAYEVGISQVEAKFMLKNGYLKVADFIDSKYYETASGEIAEGAEVVLKKISFAGITLRDIKAIVIGSENAPLLLGHNALARLGNISIDINKHLLVIHDAPKTGSAKDPDNPHNIVPDKIQLVHVEGGSFTMGSSTGEEEEQPVHSVTVKSFSIGKFEVTVGQFRAFIEATGYHTTAENDGKATFHRDGRWQDVEGLDWRYNSAGYLHTSAEDCEAVLYTSWYDARRYCEWMSSKTGKKYRLPTEAEWEFAARGGNKSKGYTYAGSNDIEAVGWVNSNTNGAIRGVGLKQPNELGIYDMTGNVIEYCSDWFDNHYYRYSPQDNPKGPADGKYRVSRGGGAHSSAADSRIKDRHWDDPTTKMNYNGFRVVVEE